MGTAIIITPPQKQKETKTKGYPVDDCPIDVAPGRYIHFPEEWQ